jgi:hypothetical protein
VGVEVPTPLGAFVVTAGVVFVAVEVVSTNCTGGGWCSCCLRRGWEVSGENSQLFGSCAHGWRRVGCHKLHSLGSRGLEYFFGTSFFRTGRKLRQNREIRRFMHDVVFERDESVGQSVNRRFTSIHRAKIHTGFTTSSLDTLQGLMASSATGVTRMAT